LAGNLAHHAPAARAGVPVVRAGELVDVTEDLGRFFRALLRPAQLADMERTVPVSADIEQIWPGGRYGLGLVRRPLPCGGVSWGHDGGDAGYITGTGVTGDGKRGVVVSMSTALGDSLSHELQRQRAADTMVQNALCRRR
jgi:D-alanyl-D-alanine carboxypeptidase